MSVHPGLGTLPAMANALTLRHAREVLARCWPDEDTTALRGELLRRQGELEAYAREVQER